VTDAVDLSIVVVSFNTRDLLRDALLALRHSSQGLTTELFVADNASSDGSADMVAREFPEARLLRHTSNLGFAAAANDAAAQAAGRYLLLLNPDATVAPQALRRAIAKMDAHPNAAVGGARLVDLQGKTQPSARAFPSPLNDWLTLSGLAARYPRSHWFGRPDRSWADDQQAARVDWVPGAFAIIRHSVWRALRGLDERFFLYFEEIDFCRRARQAHHEVWYWPDIVVKHLGGAATASLTGLAVSRRGRQVDLWRIRSTLLYHRKHHGAVGAWRVKIIEAGWHRLRVWWHAAAADPLRRAKAAEAQSICRLWHQAWRETRGGRVSPAVPW
jgi:GT2 family glycosyltransferase